MHPSLSLTDHRPWELPTGPWMWRQTWADLLFMHWPISKEILRPLVPRELNIEEFGGTSWISLVPFRMTGVMHRPLPDLPWISAFPELNLRVYVEKDGKPGVFFFSLDAGNPFAVWTAKRFFHLPYFNAEMSLAEKDDCIEYVSKRKDGSAQFKARYTPTGPVEYTKKGTLDHWITERYCLYAKSPSGRLYRHEIHHHPWPIQSVAVEVEENTFMDRWEFKTEPLLHFARRLDVVMWPREEIV